MLFVLRWFWWEVLRSLRICNESRILRGPVTANRSKFVSTSLLKGKLRETRRWLCLFLVNVFFLWSSKIQLSSQNKDGAGPEGGQPIPAATEHCQSQEWPHLQQLSAFSSLCVYVYVCVSVCVCVCVHVWVWRMCLKSKLRIKNTVHKDKKKSHYVKADLLRCVKFINSEVLSHPCEPLHGNKYKHES